MAAVTAYRSGRLTEFAAEMEMYHIPAYYALPDEDETDEEMDITS